MAGVKGRSGPPRNTNAIRSSASLLWRRGLIRAQDAWVRGPIERSMKALLGDKADATSHEQEVVEVIGRAKGCALLIEHELKACGLVNVVEGQVVVSAASDELRKWLKLELDGLRLLSPERRAKVIGGTSLAELLAAKEPT